MSAEQAATSYVLGMVATALLIGYGRERWPSSLLAELPGFAALFWPGVLIGLAAYYGLGWTARFGEWIAKGGR